MTSMEFIKTYKFIGILRHISPAVAADTVRAMYEGGVRIFEVTFNPSLASTVADTQAIIRTVKELYGDSVSVGAGTVISEDFARAAHEAGAEFIVSPCTKESVIAYTKANGMLAIPGAYTPTEILHAYEMGADIVKIFPVAPHEIGYLKNVMSPLSHIPFIPTGGINPDTVDAFLNTGAVAVAAGATIVTKELAEGGCFEKITENARLHTEIARRHTVDNQ
ncbi:MAG: bifunctional 4-hydroxy-2-oxoglutarate aldolase/2-dehydro-3-deoxy-phosphogluconate aldolase [Ruminococcaceae bacterium]|nr:bifunctional 4-hydroxy-2-oxoglutarate aldolase/2-dehydro-3-deoxy-phosphogluconate aldolase [Oscillospiraceae bacterium]